jgi:hypothetical protein
MVKRILTLSFFCITFYHRSVRKVNTTEEKIFTGTVVFQCRKTDHDSVGGDALTERRREIF